MQTIFTTRQLLTTAVVVLALIALGAQFFTSGPFVQKLTASDSVELGIVELSPRGVEGGYAMPASGCSGHVHSGESCGPGPGLTSARILSKNITQNSSWSPGNRNIIEGEEIAIAWDSTNTESCIATAGPNFGTGGLVEGTDWNVDALTVTSGGYTFTVSCDQIGGGSTVYASLTVYASAPGARMCNISTSPNPIEGGDTVMYTVQHPPSGGGSINVYACPYGGCYAGPNWDYALQYVHYPPVGSTESSFTLPYTSGVTEGTSYWPQFNVWDPNGLMVCSTSFIAGSDIDDNDPLITECNDNVDNDGDTFIDWDGGGAGAADPGCTDWFDNDETDNTVPQVELFACDLGGTNCKNVSKTIQIGEEIKLEWASVDATSCTFGAFDGDDGTGDSNDLKGIDTTITEPTAGNSTLFSVRCSGPGGIGAAFVEVETLSGAINLAVSRNVVRIGEEIDVAWDIGTYAPASCSVSGPGITAPTPLTNATGTQLDIEIESRSVYLLDCGGGVTDEEVVTVLPDILET